MPTVGAHRVRDPPRACDICGHLWYKSDLTRIGPLQWACPDDVDGLTALQISRHNANARPLIVRPVKHGMGMVSIPDYTQAEADIFNLVLKYAPQRTFLAEGGTIGDNTDTITNLDQARCAGWSAFYLANIVIENRRPLRWIQAATAKALSLCDSMLSLQFGSPSASTQYQTVTPAMTAYGGFYMPQTPLTFGGIIVLDVIGAAICTLALLRAFQVSGLTKYRDGARRAATFLRRAQCVGFYDAAIVANYAAADASGSRFQPGPFPERIAFDTAALKAWGSLTNWPMRPRGLIAAWALSLLRDLDGDSTYGDATPTGDFALPTASTLSAAVQASISWWANGAPDSSGVVVVGFGIVTPKDVYTVLASSLVTAPIWTGAPINSAHWAQGLRALWEIGGFTSQVTTIYNWLRAALPNVANEVPTTWTENQILRSLRGTYNPNLALATQIDANASDVTGSGYDWRTAGLLAPLQSAKVASDLDAARMLLTARIPRRWRMRMTATGAPAASNGSSTTVEAAQYFVDLDTRDDPRLLTQTGLSMQTSSGLRRVGWTASGLSNGHYIDLQGAAMIADAYRWDPRPPNLMEPA